MPTPVSTCVIVGVRVKFAMSCRCLSGHRDRLVSCRCLSGQSDRLVSSRIVIDISVVLPLCSYIDVSGVDVEIRCLPSVHSWPILYSISIFINHLLFIFYLIDNGTRLLTLVDIDLLLYAGSRLFAVALVPCIHLSALRWSGSSDGWTSQFGEVQPSETRVVFAMRSKMIGTNDKASRCRLKPLSVENIRQRRVSSCLPN